MQGDVVFGYIDLLKDFNNLDLNINLYNML